MSWKWNCPFLITGPYGKSFFLKMFVLISRDRQQAMMAFQPDGGRVWLSLHVLFTWFVPMSRLYMVVRAGGRIGDSCGWRLPSGTEGTSWICWQAANVIIRRICPDGAGNPWGWNDTLKGNVSFFWISCCIDKAILSIIWPGND